MDYKYKKENIDWVNTLFLFATPILAIVFTTLWIIVDGFSWAPVIIGFISYQLSGLGITMGYHRLYSHQSYDAHPIVKYILLIVGAGAVENSVLSWGSDHRRHHAKVDTEQDPYNINEGFFWAHMGWILHKKMDDSSDAYGDDLRKDKMVMWQHRNYLLLATLVAGVIPFAISYYFSGSIYGSLGVAVLAKLVFMHHCTFFINSLCHYAGNQPYTDINTARDSWWVALVSFGEGFHNFHHYFQTDYRNGVKWWHYDPSKWIVSLLGKMGLAFNIKETPKERIMAAELNMKMKGARIKFGDDSTRYEELEKMKQKVLEAIKHLQEVRKEIKKEITTFKKSDFKAPDFNEMKMEFNRRQAEFKARMKEAKEELKLAFNEFKQTLNSLELQPV
jgi:stearoyl-CoA desaturase (delta-9 desaturase)